MKRDKRILFLGVRISVEEEMMLQQIQERLERERSDAVRYLIRQAHKKLDTKEEE
jgi:hypothetical protein